MLNLVHLAIVKLNAGLNVWTNTWALNVEEKLASVLKGFIIIIA